MTLISDVGNSHEEIEYVENDGLADCYIDLGIYADGETRVKIVMMGIDEFGAYYFGARESWNSRAFAISTGDIAGRGTQVNYGKGQIVESMTYVRTYNTKSTVILGYGVFSSTNEIGQNFELNFEPINFTTPSTLLVFGVNGMYPYGASRVRIYSIEIMNKSFRIMNLIPVKNDGFGCLYDIQNPTGGPLGDGYYRTIGSRHLICGPTKS